MQELESTLEKMETTLMQVQQPKQRRRRRYHPHQKKRSSSTTHSQRRVESLIYDDDDDDVDDDVDEGDEDGGGYDDESIDDIYMHTFTVLLRARSQNRQESSRVQPNVRDWIVDTEYYNVPINVCFKKEMKAQPDVKWHILFRAFNKTMTWRRILHHRVVLPGRRNVRSSLQKTKLHEFNNKYVIMKARDELQSAGLAKLDVLTLGKLAMFCHHLDQLMWLVNIERRLQPFLMDVRFWCCKLVTDANAVLDVRTEDTLIFVGEREGNISSNAAISAKKSNYESLLWHQKFNHFHLMIKNRTLRKVDIHFEGQRGRHNTRYKEVDFKTPLSQRGIASASAPIQNMHMYEFRVLYNCDIKHATWWCATHRSQNTNYRWRSIYWMIYMDAIMACVLGDIMKRVRPHFQVTYTTTFPVAHKLMSWREFTNYLAEYAILDIPMLDEFLSILPRINMAPRITDVKLIRTGSFLLDNLNEALKLYLIKLRRGAPQFPDVYGVMEK